MDTYGFFWPSLVADPIKIRSETNEVTDCKLKAYTQRS